MFKYDCDTQYKELVRSTITEWEERTGTNNLVLASCGQGFDMMGG